MGLSSKSRLLIWDVDNALYNVWNHGLALFTSFLFFLIFILAYGFDGSQLCLQFWIHLFMTQLDVCLGNQKYIDKLFIEIVCLHITLHQ